MKHGAKTSGADAGEARTRPPKYETLLGCGDELQCCAYCGWLSPCQCDYPGSSLASADCSDPRYSDVDYAELGGDFYGACQENPDGAYVCVVAERAGKVVAVFGNCFD